MYKLTRVPLINVISCRGIQNSLGNDRHNKSRGDRKGQYRSNKKNVRKGAVFEMEALIGGALVAEMGGVLEDARSEAQAAWRKQRVRGAQVGQEVLPQARSGRDRHQRR